MTNQSLKNSQLDFDSDEYSNEAKRFRTLALRYQEIGSLSGVRITPFRSPDMPLFSKASPEQRKTATDFLETTVSIYEETIAAKESPINSKQLLWRALRQFHLVPGPDIFNLMEEEDVIIVYGETQSAIFWNLQFFKVSSYTVEELFFGHWFQLTKRDPSFQQQLFEIVDKAVNGKLTGTFAVDVPPHLVEEVDTLECIKTMMKVTFGSVLTKNGNFGGLLAIHQMKIVG